MANNWTDDELRAAVEAYIGLHRNQLAGAKVNKKKVYRDLASRFNRSESAFEYRMGNISHVYELQGRHWAKGLAPYRHAGANVISKLERILADIEGRDFGGTAAFELEVTNQRRKCQTSKPPEGNRNPGVMQSTTTPYQRDTAVIAWVLEEANGICECCGKPAPFTRSDGTPFLEVHHVQRLADGGPDTVSNAVALCPNCHREMHYGEAKSALVTELKSKLLRLQ